LDPKTPLLSTDIPNHRIVKGKREHPSLCATRPVFKRGANALSKVCRAGRNIPRGRCWLLDSSEPRQFAFEFLDTASHLACLGHEFVGKSWVRFVECKPCRTSQRPSGLSEVFAYLLLLATLRAHTSLSNASERINVFIVQYQLFDKCGDEGSIHPLSRWRRASRGLVDQLACLAIAQQEDASRFLAGVERSLVYNTSHPTGSQCPNLLPRLLTVGPARTR
jgi:hypothetical protein